MENGKTISTLYEFAKDYKMTAFRELSDQIISTGDADGLADVHLMCAQVKLMAADETLLHDLREADKLGGTLAFPCLFSSWLPQSPNSFIVFNREDSALKRFFDVLPESGELLQKWFGEDGYGAVRQIMSEILYFKSEFKEAISLAKERFQNSRHNDARSMMAGYVLFRSYLAIGDSEKAHDSLRDIISIAMGHEEDHACQSLYQTIRGWANLTTGWSGDTPRYHQTPDGIVQPVLEDRLAAIQKGISTLELTEEPFVEYAKLSYSPVETMRGLYMDVFHAMYQGRAKQWGQAEHYFKKAYIASKNSGIVMPFVEYGKQIYSIFDYFTKNNDGYSIDWLENVSLLAEKYEQSVNAYRD